MSLRLLRRYLARIPMLEAREAMRQATIAGLHRVSDGDRRRTWSAWQLDASGGYQAPLRVLTTDELRARSYAGG